MAPVFAAVGVKLTISTQKNYPCVSVEGKIDRTDVMELEINLTE